MKARLVTTYLLKKKKNIREVNFAESITSGTQYLNSESFSQYKKKPKKFISLTEVAYNLQGPPFVGQIKYLPTNSKRSSARPRKVINEPHNLRS